jgi:hypothetical protein
MVIGDKSTVEAISQLQDVISIAMVDSFEKVVHVYICVYMCVCVCVRDTSMVDSFEKVVHVFVVYIRVCCFFEGVCVCVYRISLWLTLLKR